MRIIHITKKYPDAIGGDANVVYNLSKKQIELGHSVFIITPNCSDIKSQNNLIKFGLRDKTQNLDRINIRRLLSLVVLFFSSFSYLKELKPEVIHSHSADLGFAMSLACRIYKVPMINLCHGVIFPYKENNIIKRSLEKFLLKHSNFKYIITVDMNSLSAFKKNKIKPVVYMDNAVEPIYFVPKKKVMNEKLKFLFVGRLEKLKGLDYLIHATKLLLKKTEKFEILLIGEGSEEIQLKNLVIKLNLKDFIKFLGKKNFIETKTYYLSSDVFILTSVWEGFPITLLEAWSAKLPVIITDVGGISKVCVNGENAMIIPPKNPEMIANAMYTLMTDKSLRNKIAKNGEKLIRDEYNWENITKKYINLYEKIK